MIPKATTKTQQDGHTGMSKKVTSWISFRCVDSTACSKTSQVSRLT